jgi:hypothetical protein
LATSPSQAIARSSGPMSLVQRLQQDDKRAPPSHHLRDVQRQPAA